MTDKNELDTADAITAVGQLNLDKAAELNESYEKAAGTVKGRTWMITTWVLTLQAAMIAFSVQFYTEQSGDPGFLLIQGAIALVGLALCAFLFVFIRDQGKHLKGYWIAQRKLASWNTALRGLVVSGWEDHSAPDFGVRFPPFCTKLMLLVGMFAAGFAGLFGMMVYLADMNATDPYERAIIDASVIEADEIRTLTPLRGDNFTVVTWTKHPESYEVGSDVTLGWGDVWVTVDGDVRKECIRFGRETVGEELQQLLGLPVDEDEREFVTLAVSADDLFRPCANPDVRETRCSADFPADIEARHYAWFARQASRSYASPDGFPWTRLGYTYNWKPGADEFGVPEYVIRRSATVKVVARATTGEYCAR